MGKTINPARGMRDFLPGEKLRREHAISSIRAVYRSFGYQEIETPALEDLDRLQGSGGGENLSMLFQVQKRGLAPGVPVVPESSSDLGLRYDLTLPLARFYASNATALPAVLRTMQIGPVWRAERPQKGRFRQFTQCDIDIIGLADMRAEVELITVTLLALQAIALSSVTVRLNDRRLLATLLDSFGFEYQTHAAVLISVDKLDKIGAVGVSDEISKRYPLASSSTDSLSRFLNAIQLHGKDRAGFDEVASLLPSGIDSAALLEPLRYIETNVKAALPSASIRFDPTLVRGMGYYTGPIFEVEVAGTSSSIAGGGRYDGMIGRFGGKDVEACGFSLGFERIMELLPDESSGSRKRVAMFFDQAEAPGTLLRRQMDLISKGYEVTAIPRPRKLSKALERLAGEGFGSFVDAGPDDLLSAGIVRPIGEYGADPVSNVDG